MLWLIFAWYAAQASWQTWRERQALYMNHIMFAGQMPRWMVRALLPSFLLLPAPALSGCGSRVRASITPSPSRARTTRRAPAPPLSCRLEVPPDFLLRSLWT
jgi:hypothetical protein